MFDAGYEVPHIAWLLRDLLVEILGRMRSDRVLRRPAPPRVYQPQGERPAKHDHMAAGGGVRLPGTRHTLAHQLLESALFGHVLSCPGRRQRHRPTSARRGPVRLLRLDMDGIDYAPRWHEGHLRPPRRRRRGSPVRRYGARAAPPAIVPLAGSDSGVTDRP
ncbi:hypothetical protein GCM10010112_13090 [Actinoplanes lobatus]|uniref:Transposase IS701-like DDE domain-containing protein n=1 Tax=Actinoplanes lobatus TaxID=113568 RepID=A0ABQ4APR3_9ACTN|nr:hypothetical protein GCM10010112_13090 [Actinoplanes lobatus]GIE42993.1 hypothetical protein Alo02nite_58910 [Actinoplanes lobatus]